MKLSDNDLWKQFIKSVEKLKNNNIFNRYISNQSTIVKPKIRSNSRPILEIPDIKASVQNMTKQERRKFVEEARIDLHGLTRDKVPNILSNFCQQCLQNSIRNVVIITGKGEGAIKQETYNWIISSPSYIISFFPIYDSQNESGAYAVRLRNVLKRLGV